MATPLRFPLALLALAALTACASPSSGPGAPAAVAAPAPMEAPTAAPAPETTPPAAEEPAMVCQSEKGQWAVGQIADEALVAKVRADTTSELVRIIRPGMAVTMDFREERVNLQVDADNRVVRVYCS